MDREGESVLAQQIQAFHQIAAMAGGLPELEISEFEAQLLARSISELTVHYGPVVSGPAMLWISFAGVAGMIYVPRTVQIGRRLKAMRANRNQRTETAVSDNIIHGDFTRAAPSDDDPFKPGNVG